jgi:putative solute:sodium symporter small subunit
MPDDTSKPGPDASADDGWSRTRRLTLALLAVWVFVGFGLIWFARDLNAFEFLGGPLGFWIASQGAVLVFLAIVVVYAWRMNRQR